LLLTARCELRAASCKLQAASCKLLLLLDYLLLAAHCLSARHAILVVVILSAPAYFLLPPHALATPSEAKQHQAVFDALVTAAKAEGTYGKGKSNYQVQTRHENPIHERDDTNATPVLVRIPFNCYDCWQWCLPHGISTLFPIKKT
jgi:hypothetical protein